MKLSLLFGMLCLAFSVQAQQYLYLQKGNEAPSKRLSINDHIKLQTQEEEWIEGRITDLSNKTIRIENVPYALEDILAIRTYNPLVKTLGYSLGAGGLFFTSIVLINRGLNGDEPLIYTGQVITGAVLVGSGYLVYQLSRKTYRKSRGWQYKTIDLNQ